MLLLLITILSCGSNTNPVTTTSLRTENLPPIPKLPPIVQNDKGQPTAESSFVRFQVLVASHPDPLVSSYMYETGKNGMLGVGFDLHGDIVAEVTQDPHVDCLGPDPFNEKHTMQLNRQRVADLDTDAEIIEWWAQILHEAKHVEQAREHHREICVALEAGREIPQLTPEQICAEQWNREVEAYVTNCRFANRYGTFASMPYCASVDTPKFTHEVYGYLASMKADAQLAQCLPIYAKQLEKE